MTTPLSIQTFYPTEQVDDLCATCGRHQYRGEPRVLHYFSRTDKALCIVRCGSCVEPLIHELRSLAMLKDTTARHTLKRELAAHYEATQGATFDHEAGERSEWVPFLPLRAAIEAQHEADLGRHAAERKAMGMDTKSDVIDATQPVQPPPAS